MNRLDKSIDDKVGLYIAFEFNLDENSLVHKESDGILKKIINQVEAFEANGYRVEFWNPYKNRKHSVRRITRRLPFYYLNKWEIDYSKISRYKFIYIRKAWFMDGDLIRFTRKVKEVSPNTKIILEVPTYPYDKEAKHINMIPLLIKDKKWRKKLAKYIDRIVTYSRDEMIFNVKTICISNAIDTNSIKINNITNSDVNNTINLVACSSLYYWHGYDRVIRGMNRYYLNKEVNDPTIIFHVIGQGEEADKYKQMISNYNLEEYVIMYGKLVGKKLDEIYDKCDIALDSMGRHRSGVYYNSSLKGKEYCAKGLPIISGVSTELDYDKEYKYYLRVPAEEEEIDMRVVIDFYNKVYSNSTLKKDIMIEINRYAQEHFSYSVAMQPIFDYILE